MPSCAGFICEPDTATDVYCFCKPARQQQKLPHNHFWFVCKQEQTRHTHTHAETASSCCTNRKAAERHLLNRLLGQRNGWVAGGGGRFRRRDGGVRSAFKKHLLKAAYVTLGEITHASTVLDYGINNVGRHSAHRPPDLHLRSWALLHPRVCEFLIFVVILQKNHHFMFWNMHLLLYMSNFCPNQSEPYTYLSFLFFFLSV